MRYYVVTGEPSGDMHAANLVRELKKIDDNIIVRAWGGEQLIEEGVSLAKDINETSFMGVWSVIKNLGSIKKNIDFCKKDILDFKADAIILVDYPGFNLRIAKFAKKNSIKVFYYIPPKVWAWNKGRILKLKNFVDYLLVIFPFEVAFYKKHGLDAIYVGNPLFDEISKNDYSLSVNFSKPIIALLPGSRKEEIEQILPCMLSVVETYPECQFVVGATNVFSIEFYQSFIGRKNVSIVFNETYGLLSNAKAALVASGTATLEAALFRVPQVVCYKTNWLTYVVARILIKTKYISLVNILLNKLAVQELIQYALKKEKIESGLNRLFSNHEKISNDYAKLCFMLDKKGASRNAANFIFKFISVKNLK